MSDHTPNALAAQQSTIEEWRAIPGYEGRYEVSSFGRVRSLFYHGHPRRSPKVIKHSVTNLGYLQYRLFRDDMGKNHRAHRLVLLAFVGDSPLDANHKDGDKRNNHLDNLEYVTHSENLRHAADVLKRWEGMPVADCYNEPSERDRQIWAMVDAGMTHEAIGDHFGISQPRISFIANQKRTRLAAVQGRGSA